MYIPDVFGSNLDGAIGYTEFLCSVPQSLQANSRTAPFQTLVNSSFTSQSTTDGTWSIVVK
jgi:hypothetical protein